MQNTLNIVGGPQGVLLEDALSLIKKWTQNEKVLQYVSHYVSLMKPTYFCLVSGNDEERKVLEDTLVKQGTFIPLNPKLRPGSFLARSHISDVARSEERTFICSVDKKDAGPTNNWRDPNQTKAEFQTLLDGCMKGRTMYAIPFAMGPVDSSLAQPGIQLTDSAYVVVNMRIMTHMGEQVWPLLNKKDFVRCVHSVGVPLEESQKDVPWPCNPSKVMISHFPETREVISFGSGYGGNALLGKKCLALRIASAMGHTNEWLAEHMLILGITSPEGEKKYVVGSLPSACGKTNLAMLRPTLPGWKVECVGDDIAWMRFHEDGKLYAINPETGFFGVAPGTSYKTNPSAMDSIKENSIFTNVGLTEEGDVWWEGMTDHPPEKLTDWQGNPWTPQSNTLAAHPNARFTAPASQCPVIDSHWQDPDGVPIDAIIFGGRRASTIPLIYESKSWAHGVFIGSIVSSETTAAAIGQVGKVRHDPFAMLPFCGYHMADYFDHWLQVGNHHESQHHLPKFYSVNWFRKGSDGKFLWPGFGENSRVLKWIFERSNGVGKAVDTPIGSIPSPDALDLSGLDIKKEKLEQALSVDVEGWKKEAEDIRCYYDSLGHDKVPKAIWNELENLEKRLQKP